MVSEHNDGPNQTGPEPSGPTIALIAALVGSAVVAVIFALITWPVPTVSIAALLGVGVLIYFAVEQCPQCKRRWTVGSQGCRWCGWRRPALAVPPAHPPEIYPQLQIINDVLPGSHRQMLMAGENAYHFEWMDTKGGCGSTKSAKQFIIVTDQRILYEASIKEGGRENLKYVRTSGSIPIVKVSYVGTATNTKEGCNPHAVHRLRINSGGGSIEFPFFNEQKAKRVQRVIEELITRR